MRPADPPPNQALRAGRQGDDIRVSARGHVTNWGLGAVQWAVATHQSNSNTHSACCMWWAHTAGWAGLCLCYQHKCTRASPAITVWEDVILVRSASQLNTSKPSKHGGAGGKSKWQQDFGFKQNLKSMLTKIFSPSGNNYTGFQGSNSARPSSEDKDGRQDGSCSVCVSEAQWMKGIDWEEVRHHRKLTISSYNLSLCYVIATLDHTVCTMSGVRTY